MIAKVWWGVKEGKRKIHWLSLDKIAWTKREGSLGVPWN